MPSALPCAHAISHPNNGDLVNAAQHASEALGFGKALQYTGSTDSNAALSIGIPAITIDGGGRAGSLHSPEEWFEPAGAWKGIQKALLTILYYDQTPIKEQPNKGYKQQ